jgi:hypothetical protein
MVSAVAVGVTQRSPGGKETLLTSRRAARHLMAASGHIRPFLAAAVTDSPLLRLLQ